MTIYLLNRDVKFDNSEKVKERSMHNIFYYVALIPLTIQRELFSKILPVNYRNIVIATLVLFLLMRIYLYIANMSYFNGKTDKIKYIHPNISSVLLVLQLCILAPILWFAAKYDFTLFTIVIALFSILIFIMFKVNQRIKYN